jgi:hypothetical protein
MMMSRPEKCLMFVAALALGLLFSGAQTVSAQTAPSRGNIIISEFRMHGPNGVNDEFIEIYNNTDSNIVVTDSNPITCAAQVGLVAPLIQCGWAIVDPYGGGSNIPRAIIQSGQTIPARGHYLLTNSGDATDPGYSLSGYATPDATYAPPAYSENDNFTGLALYRTADRTQFNDGNLLDAAGFGGIGLPYREDSGLQPSDGITENIQHSFVRKMNLTTDRPIDTNNNLNDFVFVATTAGAVGTEAATAVLGAPGPESATSPLVSSAQFSSSLFDPSRTAAQSPNRCYDSTDTSPGAGTKGSLFIRRKINNINAPVTQQRFRVVAITTVGSPGSTNPGQSILKPVSSAGGTALCPNTLFDGTPAVVQDTTLDPPSPASGGGLNSSLSTTPIPAGQNRNVLFRLAAERTGTFTFLYIYESK